MVSKGLKAATLLLACLLPCSAVAGQDVKEWTSASTPGDGAVLTFRGHHLGEKLNRKAFSRCADYKNEKGFVYCSEKYRSGDPLMSIMIEMGVVYMDGTMVGFMLKAPPSKRGELSGVLEGKYGAPTEVMQNVRTWTTPWGTLLNQDICDDRTACAYFQTEASLSEMTKRRDEAIRSMGKKGL